MLHFGQNKIPPSQVSAILLSLSNPLTNPNSSLSAEKVDEEPSLTELAEDIWEEVVEDIAEEMMAEQLAEEQAHEEDEEEEEEGNCHSQPREEKTSPDFEPPRKTSKTKETDENADWRPVVSYQGQDWNLA